MLKPEHMSVAEKQFIRAYVRAMRRDFSLVESVLALMHPDQLALTDLMQAINVAVELRQLQAEFETTLANTPTLQPFMRKALPTGPSMDDLADMFALSFFKIFTVLENKKAWPKKQDAGWFSGQPEEWYKVFKELEITVEKSEKKQSPIFNMFSKFFPQLELFKNFHLAQPPDEAPVNEWPPAYPWHGFMKNQKSEYEEEEDYDEEEDEE